MDTRGEEEGVVKVLEPLEGWEGFILVEGGDFLNLSIILSEYRRILSIIYRFILLYGMEGMD